KSMLICQYVCYCCRPGSFRADAFRGHSLSLLEKITLRGLRTCAIPAGVTALHSPGLVKLYDVFILLLPQSMVRTNTSGGKTRRRLREERPRRDPTVRQHEEAHQPPTESIVFFRSDHLCSSLKCYVTVYINYEVGRVTAVPVPRLIKNSLYKHTQD